MQTSLPETGSKTSEPLIFFIAPKNEPELHPEQKLPAREAELFKGTENGSPFAQNTTSWD